MKSGLTVVIVAQHFGLAQVPAAVWLCQWVLCWLPVPPSAWVSSGTALLWLCCGTQWPSSLPGDLYIMLCNVVQICPMALLKLPTRGSQGNCLLAFCTDIILCFSDCKTHCSWLSGIYTGRFEGIISFSLWSCVETDPSLKPKISRNGVLPAAASTPWEAVCKHRCLGCRVVIALLAPKGLGSHRHRAALRGLGARPPLSPMATLVLLL